MLCRGRGLNMRSAAHAARRRDEWRAWVAHQNVGGHQVAKGGVARRRDDEEDEPAKSLKVIEGGVVQEKRERVQV